ncbi:MAG: hypothetical protein LUG99_12000 [Lachnospiraceae bacterium]|nr:hypothetical protein [Lachnospiraceae bacterium]
MSDKMKGMALVLSDDTYLKLLEEAEKRNLSLDAYITSRLLPSEEYRTSTDKVEAKEIDETEAGVLCDLLSGLGQLEQCMATAMRVVHKADEAEKRIKSRRLKDSCWHCEDRKEQ